MCVFQQFLTTNYQTKSHRGVLPATWILYYHLEMVFFLFLIVYIDFVRWWADEPRNIGTRHISCDDFSLKTIDSLFVYYIASGKINITI